MTRALPPLIAVVLAAAWFSADLRGPSSPPDQLQIHEYGRIPVVEGGRVKPMDSVARNHLRIMAERETFRTPEGQSRPAIEWLMDVQTEMFSDREQRARKHRVFRIVNEQLQNALGLDPKREGYRYSIDEFADKLTTLAEPLRKAHERKESGHALDPYENQLFEFERHLGIYQRLSQFATPHVIPPKTGDHYVTLPEAVPKGEAAMDSSVAAWKEMLVAYGAKDAAKFNAAVKSYLDRMEQERPRDVRRAALEARFNHEDPFNKCKWLYLLGFVLAAASWMGWRSALNWSAWSLLVFTFVVHTIALCVRIYLSGRPPVTNLYSSAVFIGWGAALIGIVLALILRAVLKNDTGMSLGSIVTAVSGFSTLQIAHILAADGDTMEVLQAVLDTQFWLATHVTCITLGYATTYVAGLIGILYIVMGVFTGSLTLDIARILNRVMYGVICFATFFSFVGTVLGGLWADDSWGRFWGWDPKENGALMIVLWNAILLHARWGGLVRERGLAVLAVLGNIVVSWSWFGVNQLGVGLHSYGFTSGVTITLVIYAFSQLAIAGCGLFPPELWRSKLPAAGAQGKSDA
jgi:ABC-type transport system involved in cytochrome c biogenesis permease subunit